MLLRWFIGILLLGCNLVSKASAQEAVAPVPSVSDRATTENLARMPRVAFVDIEVVLGQSRAIRSIMSSIDDELAQKSADIDQKRRQARRIQLSLEQQGAVLSDQERRKREQQAIDLLSEVDELEYRFEREVRDRQRDVVEPLLEQVILTIGDVGRRQEFDLIVRGEMVLYGRSAADLTPAVIEEIDKREEQLRESLMKAEKKEEEDNEDVETLPLLP